jgi:3-deoxy-D-manno-octulosonic-acid transferase
MEEGKTFEGGGLVMNLLTMGLSRLLWPVIQMKGEPTSWRFRWELAGFELQPADLWVHTASLGEISPFFPILERITLSRKVAVTITSGRSFDAVCRRLDRIAQVIPLPIEGSPAMDRLLESLHPKRMIILEGEFWPILVKHALSKKIRITFLGARTKGLKNFLWSWVLRSQDHQKYLDGIWVSTPKERENFLRLGLSENKVHDGFHPKLLTPIPPTLPQAFMNLLKLGKPTLVAGSIHEEELGFLGTIYTRLKTIYPELSMIVVPRYPREGKLFLQRLHSSGIPSAIWPDLKPVTIVDRFGVLPSLYGLGKVALVGGSWVDLGGHNPVEPLYHGVPVILGPYHHHLEDLLPLLPKGSVTIVKKVEEAVTKMITLLENPPLDRLFWKETLSEERQKTEQLIDKIFLHPDVD